MGHKSAAFGRGQGLRYLQLVAILLILTVAVCMFCGMSLDVNLLPKGARMHSRSLLLGTSRSGDSQATSAASADRPQSLSTLNPDCHHCPTCPQVQQQATSTPVSAAMTSSVLVNNPRAYHVITSAQGFANHWQARIHYYWYKKQRQLCQSHPVCDMGGFTRLLHSGEPDDLMDEIPTVVVKPLPESALKESGGGSYIVLNRPFAFMEWLRTASIPERYILMCEGDHLFMRPLPNLMPGEASGGALFTYINPKEYPSIVRSFIGDVPDSELALVPRIGNSPTFISVHDFRKLAPFWYNTTMEIWRDETAHKAWTWVLEMYGYSLATFRAGLHKGLKTYSEMLAHPPYDAKTVDYKGDPFYLLHLTYPMHYNTTGGVIWNATESIWSFDKRTYGDKAPPRKLPLPPPVIQSELAPLIITMLNEATEAIPCWDEYVATKVVTSVCAPGQADKQDANTAFQKASQA